METIQNDCKQVFATNTVFETLYKVDVREHCQEKNGFTYLSWAWAWAYVMKIYPESTHEIVKHDGKPFVYDEHLGYMVETVVNIEGISRGMHLPVLDSGNNPMKAVPYKFFTKWNKEKHVKAATMFDINTAIMRCLVKNLAMFGLGLYIYAGEDLPEDLKEAAEQQQNKYQTEAPQNIAYISEGDQYQLVIHIKKKGLTVQEALKRFGLTDLSQIPESRKQEAAKQINIWSHEKMQALHYGNQRG